jgi:hypothetical protein
MAWQEQASSQKNTQQRIQTFLSELFQKALAWLKVALFPICTAAIELIRWDFESKVVNIVPYEVMIQL